MKKCPRCKGSKFWLLAGGKKRCAWCGLTRKSIISIWQLTRISPYWKGRLLEYFCLGVPAFRLRHQVPLNRKTIERWFTILRLAIYTSTVLEKPILNGALEIDESAFGGKHPGKRGWGAVGKHLAFGIYQRNGKVITFPITSRAQRTLKPLITSHTKTGSLYYTDDWHAYTFLDIRGDHVVIKKEKGKPKGRDHLNSIEGFWSYAKHWLYHYRGIPKPYFHLYLKEVEWRFNNRERNIINLLRRLLENQQIVKVLI